MLGFLLQRKKRDPRCLVAGSPCMRENKTVYHNNFCESNEMPTRPSGLFLTPSWPNSPIRPRLLEQQVRSPTPFGWAPGPPFACKRSNENLRKHSSPPLNGCSRAAGAWRSPSVRNFAAKRHASVNQAALSPVEFVAVLVVVVLVVDVVWW